MTIPRFEWENDRGDKGFAEFSDPQDLSGNHVTQLRNAMGSSENPAKGMASFFDLAFKLLIVAWEVPRPGKPDLRLPRHDNKARDEMPGSMMVALERHIEPHLRFITKAGVQAEEQDLSDLPGSPTQPDSE